MTTRLGVTGPMAAFGTFTPKEEAVVGGGGVSLPMLGAG
jgi:hypothetical protein